MIALLVQLLVGLTSAVSVNGFRDKAHGMEVAESVAAYKDLQIYLESNVTSDSWQVNLEAAKKLISKFHATNCIIGICISSKGEPNIVKASKRFVHLLELAHTSNSNGCNQLTLDYLHELNLAHTEPPKEPPVEGRFHLDTFGRVDRLLDQVFEGLMKRCSSFVDQMYERKFPKLTQSVERKLFSISDRNILKYEYNNYEEFLIYLMREIDLDRYQTAMRASTLGFDWPFIAYFKDMYTHLFRLSCDTFQAKFENEILQLERIISHAQLYKIRLNHSYPVIFGLKRRNLCVKFARMSDLSLHNMARSMYLKIKFGQI